MTIVYNDKTDLLYIRFDDVTQDVVNKRVSEDIVLDIGRMIELWASRLWTLPATYLWINFCPYDTKPKQRNPFKADPSSSSSENRDILKSKPPCPNGGFPTPQKKGSSKVRIIDQITPDQGCPAEIR